MNISKLSGLLVVVMLGGCIATTFPYMRAETAQRIAAPAWMIKRDIAATPYSLRSYERIHERGSVANIYIEGEGSEFTSPLEWKDNPTPKNPVALHLASKDRADNVIYLARPCQYNETISKKPCEPSTWKENRFSAEIIESFNTALDDIINRYDIRGVNLIGYSGGAAIATLLAASRKDILSVRTVAGILDHKTQRSILDMSGLNGSLNPVDAAPLLAKTPQYHFIGGQDRFVPPAVLHSYLQAMPATNCAQTMLVQEARYEEGWVNKWSELLELPVTCYKKSNISHDFGEITQPTPPKEPVFIVREKPAKP